MLPRVDPAPDSPGAWAAVGRHPAPRMEAQQREQRDVGPPGVKASPGRSGKARTDHVATAWLQMRTPRPSWGAGSAAQVTGQAGLAGAEPGLPWPGPGTPRGEASLRQTQPAVLDRSRDEPMLSS